MLEFAAFDGQKYLSLETYRRSGIGVRTPVWFAADFGDVLYVYTMAKSGKAKRIRLGDAVRIAPCNSRGRVTGNWIPARANLVTGAAFEHGMHLLNAKYWPVKQALDLFVRYFARHQRVMIEIRPAN